MWADDWDVDYSVYYEGKSAGDIDSKQAVEIREDEARRWNESKNFRIIMNFRTGSLAESVFRRPNEEKTKTRRRRYSGSDVTDVEQYTKRIGSRLMKRFLLRSLLFIISKSCLIYFTISNHTKISINKMNARSKI